MKPRDSSPPILLPGLSISTSFTLFIPIRGSLTQSWGKQVLRRCHHSILFNEPLINTHTLLLILMINRGLRKYLGPKGIRTGGRSQLSFEAKLDLIFVNLGDASLETPFHVFPVIHFCQTLDTHWSGQCY